MLRHKYVHFWHKNIRNIKVVVLTLSSSCATGKMFSTWRECIEWLTPSRCLRLTTTFCHRTNGAEFQILSYLCPLLCTGGGEFVQEGGEFILVLQHKDKNYSQFIETFKVKTTSILKWHFKLETAIVTLMDNPTNRCSSHWEHKEQLEKNWYTPVRASQKWFKKAKLSFYYDNICYKLSAFADTL